MGTVAMGCAIAGLFFLRFWKETKDRLFLSFTLAFFHVGQSIELYLALLLCE
jgi:hypothetical protein